jgi:DNA replication protein DnaC
MSRASEEVLLDDHLHRLKLPAMLRQYRECGRAARETAQSYESYLLDLTGVEVEQRRARQLERRLYEAHFPVLKTLENTELSKWPGLEALQLREYAEGHYIARRENIILIGKHGTGKTHAATVLGVEACRRGYRVLFQTAADLVNTLLEAREERHLKRTLERLTRYQLLILDEVGYIPFSPEGAQLLFQVFSDRYEKGSMLVTSNLPFAQWTTVFGDAALTAALLDRLTHHSTIHEFNWESHRFAESMSKKQKSKKSVSREVAATSGPAGPNKDMNQEGAPAPLDS